MSPWGAFPSDARGRSRDHTVGVERVNDVVLQCVVVLFGSVVFVKMRV